MAAPAIPRLPTLLRPLGRLRPLGLLRRLGPAIRLCGLCATVSLGLGLHACAGPATPIDRALPVVVGIVDRDVLERHLSEVPRADAERAGRVAELFRSAGCAGSRFERRRVAGSRLPNLVCTLPGRSRDEIVVGAHFDRSRSGLGVADNWTGVTLLPALYRALRTAPRRHTFRFVAFTDVMKDHAGSEYFLRALEPEEIDSIRAMVNLKGLGLGSTAVWASRADPDLRLDLFSVSRSLDLPLRYVDLGRAPLGFRADVAGTVRGALVTGHSPHSTWGVRADANTFRRRGIPTIVIHSVSRETARLFTRPHLDRGLEPIRLDDYHESFRLIAAYLAYLDDTLEIRDALRAQNGSPERAG